MLTYMVNNCNAIGHLNDGVVNFLMDEYGYSRRGVCNFWKTQKTIALNTVHTKPLVVYRKKGSGGKKKISSTSTAAAAVPPRPITKEDAPTAAGPVTAAPPTTAPTFMNTRSKKRRAPTNNAVEPVCPVCSWRPTARITSKAIKNNKRVHATDDCLQCTQIDIQLKKAAAKNLCLQTLFDDQCVEKVDCQKEERVFTADLNHFLQSNLSPDVSSKIAGEFDNTNISVRIIELETYIACQKSFDNKCKEINGSVWRDEEGKPHFNMLERSPTEDITIVLFPERHKGDDTDDNNFIAIGRSHYDQQDIDSFSEEEDAKIREGVLGPRPGAASGVFIPGSKSLNQSPATQKDTSLTIASGSHGVGCVMYYLNCGLKFNPFNYGALKMNRMSHEAKAEEAERCTAYRNMLVKEAMYYLKVMACLEQAGVPLRTSNGSALPRLSAIMEKYSGRAVQDVLVQWMCNTGEMRNHQATACHVDVNRSHCMEIYSLIRRHGATRGDGMLYLPLDNACLSIKCNSEMIVCNLSVSPHVPDQSRNHSNISKVHGPKP